MTDSDTPLNAIREVIRSIRPKSKHLSMDDAEFRTLDLSEDIGLDSLDIINFFFKVEQSLGKTISAEEIDSKQLTKIENLETFFG